MQINAISFLWINIDDFSMIILISFIFLMSDWYENVCKELVFATAVECPYFHSTMLLLIWIFIILASAATLFSSFRSTLFIFVNQSSIPLAFSSLNNSTFFKRFFRVNLFPSHPFLTVEKIVDIFLQIVFFFFVFFSSHYHLHPSLQMIVINCRNGKLWYFVCGTVL